MDVCTIVLPTIVAGIIVVFWSIVFFDRSLGSRDAEGIEFFVTTQPLLHKVIKSTSP